MGAPYGDIMDHLADTRSRADCVAKNRNGNIKQTGARRKNESGMTATVWRIAPNGGKP